jgi:ABC-type lipoprotein export system ATPase subunit
VRAGQLVALRGRSGSGKTTLLNIVGGLDLPDSGQVRVGDRDVTAMSDHERMELRRSSVAFIFQSFGLIPILSAAENVGVPLRIAGMAPKAREERVRLMLDIVGLGEHADSGPASCPAASSSGSRSPGRWPAARRYCWPTSPPASSTRRRRSRSCGCCAPWCSPRG